MIIKVVSRNLKKHPFLNLVKIVGLSLALSCIVFIVLFLKYELTYDRHHDNVDRIYRLTVTHPNFLGGKHFARLSESGFIIDFKDKTPEIENFARLEPVKGGALKHNEMHYRFNQGFMCDSTYTQVFNVDLLVGNVNTIFAKKGSMIVSESFAQKLFGDVSPIGEIVTVPTGQFYGEKLDFTINGVMRDYPANSHFHPDFLATPPSGWKTGWAYTYLLLSEKANLEKTLASANTFVKAISNKHFFNKESEVFLQAVGEIHLHSNKFREIEQNGNMTNVYVLAIAAFVLLLISISNYANLNLGMAGFSSKFIYVNKVMGSSRKSVLKYFTVEGVIIVLLSIILSVLILIPTNNVLIMNYGLNLLQNNAYALARIGLVFIVLGIFTSVLPILKPVYSFLSFGAVNQMKYKGGVISRGLVVFQYAISIALIIAVITISRQTKFALGKGMGVDDNNVICFEDVHSNVQQKFEVFKEEALKNKSIESVSAMMEPPGGEANDMFSFEMEGYVSPSENSGNDRIGVFPCDYSFAELFDLTFLSGNNFNKDNTDNDGSGEYIINRAAMHRLNYTNADDIVGKEFKLNFNTPGIEIPRGKIIGVVDDFHLSSLKKQVEPLVMFKRDKLWLINFVVSHKKGMRQEAIADLQNVWVKVFPDYPFSYEHVGAMYQKVYKSELLQAKLLSIFTIIALFICSMGLLGLALIVSQPRIKEIGIRKINGANISEVLILLNRDFVKWVIIAFVIATPIAWFAMHKWLENFAYKTELSWWIFAVAGLLALGIALITVSWQSWRAATRNPVEALRSE